MMLNAGSARAAGIALLCAIACGNCAADGDARHGAYLVKAAGCMACHTAEVKDAVAFAGGRAIKTPFGTFYGPNITPDAQAGVGRWTEADFIRAMREGVRRDGANLFPAFPYPSFTRMSGADLRDVWAYLRTLPPNGRASEPHQLRAPFGWRFLVTFWKWLYFTPGPFVNDPRLPANVNRGAYFVQALGHCGECHTPRNFLGGPDRARLLAGGKDANGKRIPNLTPARLGEWSDAELKDFFTSGAMPDGDVVAEAMGEVIRNTTSQLTAEDLAALIAYLRSLPAIADEPK
jgi:mono/diheme cytochrome c family protein